MCPCWHLIQHQKHSYVIQYTHLFKQWFATGLIRFQIEMPPSNLLGSLFRGFVFVLQCVHHDFWGCLCCCCLQRCFDSVCALLQRGQSRECLLLSLQTRAHAFIPATVLCPVPAMNIGKYIGSLPFKSRELGIGSQEVLLHVRVGFIEEFHLGSQSLRL